MRTVNVSNNSMLLTVSREWKLFVFFFNDTATTEIYTLSLHDALPILAADPAPRLRLDDSHRRAHQRGGREDRKSTRLNSSHANISYAVFCLKKKKNNTIFSYTHIFTLSLHFYPSSLISTLPPL